MTREKKRIPYFDFLRGIAILFVVSIHTYELSPMAGNIWDDIKIFLGQIIQCAVPVFIAISGFFLVQKQTQYLPFLKRQIPRVYIPLLIWSLPYFIMALNGGYNLFTASVLYLCCGFSIYYFVALIMQFYILSPILCKFNKLGGGNFSLSNYGNCRIVRFLRAEHQRCNASLDRICRSVPRMAGFFQYRYVSR